MVDELTLTRLLLFEFSLAGVLGRLVHTFTQIVTCLFQEKEKMLLLLHFVGLQWLQYL